MSLVYNEVIFITFQSNHLSYISPGGGRERERERKREREREGGREGGRERPNLIPTLFLCSS